jgi:hypothetical protein
MLSQTPGNAGFTGSSGTWVGVPVSQFPPVTLTLPTKVAAALLIVHAGLGMGPDNQTNSTLWFGVDLVGPGVKSNIPGRTRMSVSTAGAGFRLEGSRAYLYLGSDLVPGLGSRWPFTQYYAVSRAYIYGAWAQLLASPETAMTLPIAFTTTPGPGFRQRGCDRRVQPGRHHHVGR